MTVPEEERYMMVGGSWDGETLPFRGPRVLMPGRRPVGGWVTDAGADLDPTPLASETYYLTTLSDGRRVYLHDERYAAVAALDTRAEAFRARAREYASEAARAECDHGVNRVFADWAYLALIDARILEAQQAELLRPRPRPVPDPPDGGETLH